MPQLSSKLAALVAAHYGLVTTEQLIADGIGEHAIRRLVTQGALIRCHQQVYRVATSPQTFRARCLAACLAEPTAVITGPAGSAPCGSSATCSSPSDRSSW